MAEKHHQAMRRKAPRTDLRKDSETGNISSIQSSRPSSPAAATPYMTGARSPGSIISSRSSSATIPKRTVSGASSHRSVSRDPVKRLRDEDGSITSTRSSLYDPEPNNTPRRGSIGSERPRKDSNSTAKSTEGVPISFGPDGEPSAVVPLRRTGSRRQHPTQIPARQTSKGSHASHQNRPINDEHDSSDRTTPGGQAADDGLSLHSRSTDPSLSELSSHVSADYPRPTFMNKVFGAHERGKGTSPATKKEKEDEEKENSKRKRIKEKIMENLKSTAEVAKPMIRDTLETAGSYGRMFGPIAIYLAPAALVGLWAWDALQLVETNKQTCQDLLDGAVLQHQGLIDLLRKCREDSSLMTEHNESFIRQVLEKHRDACNAVYDSVLAQKNQRYIMRFIQRKPISESTLASAKGKLSDAMLEYMRAITTMTWANSAQTHKLAQENHNKTRNILEMLSSMAAALDDQDKAVEWLRSSLREIIPINEERESTVTNLMRQRREGDSRRDEKSYLETRIADVTRALEDLAPLGESREDTIKEIEATKRYDDARKRELEGRPRLTNDDKYELEVLRLRLQLHDRLITALKQKAPTQDHAVQTDPYELMLPLHTKVSQKSLAPKAGQRPRQTDAEFELEPDNDALSDSSTTSSDARIYQKQLVLHYPPKLRVALWKPRPVQVGDVGYIDEDGSFVWLFNASKACNEPGLQSLSSFVFRAKDDTGSVKEAARADAITKRTKRAFVVRKTDSTRALAELFKQPIRKTRAFGRSDNGRRAIHVVDDPQYTRIGSVDHEKIKTWFNDSIEGILKAFKQKKLSRNKIILVTGVLSAKHWGLLVTKTKVQEKIYFCEFDKVRKGNRWGAFSIDKATNYESGKHYTSRISQHNPDKEKNRWDAVLLSALHFPVKSNGQAAHHCQDEEQIGL